ncbi:hypothetical protein AGLY_012726 [Aphis glycines]|uniref:Uncharacterized protein n=1 Tax=Aphis glycines TaxID=307491 RepID=A0A6G0T9B6_APHGL|nr:hypothetical protein AGLY_012726 [Aphis glycines]
MFNTKKEIERRPEVFFLITKKSFNTIGKMETNYKLLFTDKIPTFIFIFISKNYLVNGSLINNFRRQCWYKEFSESSWGPSRFHNTFLIGKLDIIRPARKQLKLYPITRLVCTNVNISTTYYVYFGLGRNTAETDFSFYALYIIMYDVTIYTILFLGDGMGGRYCSYDHFKGARVASKN